MCTIIFLAFRMCTIIFLVSSNIFGSFGAGSWSRLYRFAIRVSTSPIARWATPIAGHRVGSLLADAPRVRVALPPVRGASSCMAPAGLLRETRRACPFRFLWQVHRAIQVARWSGTEWFMGLAAAARVRLTPPPLRGVSLRLEPSCAAHVTPFADASSHATCASFSTFRCP